MIFFVTFLLIMGLVLVALGMANASGSSLFAYLTCIGFGFTFIYLAIQFNGVSS